MTAITEQTSGRLEASYLQPNRLADHAEPLRPPLVGRGTVEMTGAEVDATYADAPVTDFGIARAAAAQHRGQS